MAEGNLEGKIVLVEKYPDSKDVSVKSLYIGKCIRDDLYMTLENAIHLSPNPLEFLDPSEIIARVFSSPTTVSAFPDDTRKSEYNIKNLEIAMNSIGYNDKKNINRINNLIKN